MRIPTVEVIAGTTLRATWVSSGMTPSTIGSALRSGSETIVNSVAAVASGDGHYFALNPIPTSGGWYINEWVAVIASNTYVDRQLVRSSRVEAD